MDQPKEPRLVLYATPTKESFLKKVNELLSEGYSWWNRTGCNSVAVHEDYWEEYKEKTVLGTDRPYKGLIYYTHSENPEFSYFHVIQPKEKTIENVEVGDYVIGEKITIGEKTYGAMGQTVIETTTNLFAIKPIDDICWFSKKDTRWKVEQPETEEVKGEKNSQSKHPWGDPMIICERHKVQYYTNAWDEYLELPCCRVMRK